MAPQATLEDESRLLEHARRGWVPVVHAGLHALEAEPNESVARERDDSLRREAAAPVRNGEPVADLGRLAVHIREQLGADPSRGSTVDLDSERGHYLLRRTERDPSVRVSARIRMREAITQHDSD